MSAPTKKYCVAIVCLALVAITFAVFGRTAAFGFVNYDDDMYVYENPVVTKGLTLKGVAWAITYGEIGHRHPLTWLSHMADCQIYGLWAGGHHLTSVALHALAAMFLFLALHTMTASLWRSAFVAAVFAVHPLRVESVVWISERKDVLSGVFFMLTLWAYARYAQQPSRGRYAAVAAWYGVGLLCKNSLVTLPFVLLLLDWWPLQRVKPGAPFWGLVKEKIPLFLLTIGSCVATFLVPEKMPGFGQIPFLECVENAVVSYGIYLRQIVFPTGLAIPYINPPNGLPFWEMTLAFGVLAAISIGVLAFRKGRPYLVVGWLWYLGMLVPMIGLVQPSYLAHADRYTYLSGIGLTLAGTWVVEDWSASWKHRQLMLGGLMAAVIGVLMVCAWTQAGYWKSNETLWLRTLACDPGNFMAHYNLGNVLRQKGKMDEAIAQYREAVQSNPSYGKAHNNLGIALRQQGNVDEAIAQFQAALQIMPDNESIHFNLARAFLQKGSNGEAIVQYQLALQIAPADIEVQNNLAWLLATSPSASLRNGEKAVQLARQANELAGGKSPVILGTLAAALAETGQFGEARESAQKAIELARAAGQKNLVEQFNRELQRYEARFPLHP